MFIAPYAGGALLSVMICETVPGAKNLVPGHTILNYLLVLMIAEAVIILLIHETPLSRPLNVLMTSFFQFIMGYAILDQFHADCAAMEKRVKEAQESSEGLDSLIGEDLSNQDDIRFIPDLLQNEDGYFFPVFTDVEAMGEYGENFSKIEKHFLETIILARNSKEEVQGIVVNAFTEPFVLNRDLFELVEKMKSRIADDPE